jgi:hypothetical protein
MRAMRPKDPERKTLQTLPPGNANRALIEKQNGLHHLRRVLLGVRMVGDAPGLSRGRRR